MTTTTGAAPRKGGWDDERMCHRPARYSAVNGAPDFGGDDIDYYAGIYGISRRQAIERLSERSPCYGLD